MIHAPLQFGATGTGPAIAVAVIGLLALSVVLSVAIAAILIGGYRRGPRQTGMLWLAVGLVLLTTVPELLRIGLPTFTAIGTVARSLIVSGFELAGLGVILWTLYGDNT
jgi:hypothetical protein